MLERGRRFSNGNSDHLLDLDRTDEAGGRESGRILRRTGVKGLRIAKDQAVEEAVCDCDLQLIFSRTNEIGDVGLVWAQEQRGGVLAINRNLGNIFHVAEIENEPTSGIRCGSCKCGCVSAAS